jgi:AmmeMemoRadiSam system protein A
MSGLLRGCFGMIEAVRPLCFVVVENAYTAAFRDRRFTPVSKDEINHIKATISILSPREPLACRDQAHLLEMLRPGIDGLTIQDGPYMATFLPVMWESLKTPEEFLAHLKIKAGMQLNHWSSSMYVTRFRTVYIG